MIPVVRKLVAALAMCAAGAVVARDYLPSQWWPSPWGADDERGAQQHAEDEQQARVLNRKSCIHGDTSSLLSEGIFVYLIHEKRGTIRMKRGYFKSRSF